MQYLISHLVSWFWDERDVVLSNVKYESYRLSGSAAYIWSCFREPRTIDEAIDSVVHEFEIDRATAIKDTKACVDSLVSLGFLLKYQPSRVFSP